MKILVIDDDTDFADGLAEMLCVFGHDADVAYTSQAGLDAADGAGFDLALVDIGLAGQNGADCARTLKKNHPDMHCVLTTGYSAETVAEMGVSADEFITLRKPIKPDDLSAILS